MKIFPLVLWSALVLVATARAEEQFPEYEGLPPAEKNHWGYVIDRTGLASFILTIPSQSSDCFRDARLFIRDKSGSRMSEITLVAGPAKNKSLVIQLKLGDTYGDSSRYSAELVIYTSAPAGSAIDTLYKGGFGGFTFKIPMGLPNKQE